MEQLYDVTIIGGGPAGLYSTFYAGVRQLKVKCIEASPALGGRLLLYPNYTISDLGGQPPILCQQFIEQLIAQAHRFDPTFCLEERVIQIEEQATHFIIETTKARHYSKTIIYATGYGYFEPKKLTAFPLTPSLEPFYTYTIAETARFIDKEVLLYGNANITAEWALQLKPYAKTITLVTDEAQWQIAPHVLKRLAAAQIATYCGVRYEQAIVQDGKVHCQFDQVAVQFDWLVIQPGFQRRANDFSQQLVMASTAGTFEGNAAGCTSNARIFAAGDCLNYEGKLNFLTGAFHDAMNAVNYAAHAVDQTQSVAGVVSTHNNVFRSRLC